MFWIPGLSIMVFCLILIPSTILGYKKGWRGAVFVSILLLAFTMLWVGIGYLIYHSALWPVYRDKILSKDLRVHLNLDALQDTFRLRVVLLFAGLLSPFSYLFVFVIWKLLREKINKYLGPKTKESGEEYKKDMIYRKSAVPSRVGGIAIMGGSTLLVSSMVASAISTLSVPYGHRDKFTDFNDALGRIYGLGQIDNSSDAAAIESFMKEIDGPMVNGIQELANFGSQHTTRNDADNFIPNFKTITDTFKGGLWTAINDLMQTDAKAAAGIFNLILKSNNQIPTVDPLKFYGPTNTATIDGVGNQIGYGAPRTVLLNEVQSQFKANPLSVRLAPLVIDALIKHFESSFIAFDKTPFASNLKAAQENLKNLQSILANMNKGLGEQRKELKESQDNLAMSVQRYKELNGQEYDAVQKDGATVNGSATSSPIPYIQYDWKTPPSAPVPGTLHAIGIDNVNKAQAAYDAYNTGTYEPKRIENDNANQAFSTAAGKRNSLQTDVDTSIRLLNEAKHNLSESTRVKGIAEITLRSDETELSTLITRLNNAKNTLPSKEALFTTAENAITTLTGQISTEDSNIQTLHTDIAGLNTQLQTKQAELAAALTEPERVTIRSEINAIQISLNTKNGELTTSTNTARTLRSQRDTKLSEKHSLQKDIENLKGIIAISTTRKQTLEASIANLKTEIANHEADIRRYTAAVSNQDTALKSHQALLKDHIDNVWTPAHNNKDRINAEFNTIWRKWTDLKTKLDQYKHIVQQYEQDEINLKSRIETLNNKSKAAAIEIAKLLRNTWSITSDAQQLHEPTASTDEQASIAYMTWRIKYQNSIIKNNQTIYDAKLAMYNDYKAKLIKAYSAWLRKES